MEVAVSMSIIEILANVVLLTMIGTVNVGIIAYVAYKVRELRKPTGRAELQPGRDGEPVFVTRYVPAQPLADECEAAASARPDAA